MILDQLLNSTAYEGLHPLFPRAFAYLRDFDPNTPDGRYELHGQDLFALVQRYRTAPAAEKSWEAHRARGDIQMVCQGVELCGHADQATLAVSSPYDQGKDVEKYAAPTGLVAPVTWLTLGRGNFVIFHPQDGHQPGVAVDAPADILKVVIKFRLQTPCPA